MTALSSLSPRPPRAHHSVLELSRVFFEASSGYLLKPLMRALPKGDGHSVMTLPGFFGADGSTASLRRFLDRQRYNAIPWGLGRNIPSEGLATMEATLEFRHRTEQALAQSIAAEVGRTRRKVSLVGWSLGGLYATSLAHRHPDLIRQVVTLGTPFGDPRGTSVYSVMQRMNNAEVAPELLEQWSEHTFAGNLEVPVTAVYSQSDGIVGESIAKLPEHPLMESIAVIASHIGFPFNPLVRALLCERLGQNEGRWQPWQQQFLKPLIHQPG